MNIDPMWIMAIPCLLSMCLVLSQLLATLKRIEKQLKNICTAHGVDGNGLEPLSDHVKQLADDPRRKILAIKALRDETGCGLAEAKEAVEAYMRSQKQVS